jgi:hypothetical protein
MNPRSIDSSRYSSLRRGGKLLARLAFWVQLGLVILGLGLFLDQAQALLSDAQFTWGERRVMGIVALITLGGCGLAGWILGQLFKVSAELIDVVADGAEASWRTGDLIEQHVIPTLGRIAAVLEAREGASGVRSASPGPDSQVKRLRTELDAARSVGSIRRVIEIRDALTQHLRGEPLHALDGELALWLHDLVERRVRAGTCDAELAGGVARALDSFGDMPEADRLRATLPTLRRRAGLCQRCGQAVPGGEATCADCRRGRSVSSALSDPVPRASSHRERP